jgi:hypothetical protein
MRHRCSDSILENTVILLTELFNHGFHYLLLAMTELKIVHMKADIHLLAFNYLVGHTRILRVGDESNVHQTLHKLAVVQKACSHCTI